MARSKTRPQPSLLQILDDYWLARRRELSKHTVTDYELTFRRLISFLDGGDNHPFTSITTEDINRFLNHLESDYNLGKKSLANAWTALSALWTHAAANLDMPHVIRNKIKRPRTRRRELSEYTQSEVKAMLASCARTQTWTGAIRPAVTSERPTMLRDMAIIAVLLDTGIRASELCDLKIGNFKRNKDSASLYIACGKGEKDRTVFLGIRSQRLLTRYLLNRPGVQPTAPLFAANENHMRSDNLYHLIQRVGQRAGVEKANVHKFRHTFAITFLRNGGNVLELQALLGHESLETIRIYVRLANIDLQTAMRRASPADNWKI